MEITEDTGKVLYDAVKDWLRNFDWDVVPFAEGNTPGRTEWEIKIEPVNPRQSKAWVVWDGDPVQVCLGRGIRVERLEDDPEVVLPFLDAAANGLIEERLWKRGSEIIWSKAEIKLPEDVWKESRGGLEIWRRNVPPDEIIVYEPWVRKKTAPLMAQ